MERGRAGRQMGGGSGERKWEGESWVGGREITESGERTGGREMTGGEKERMGEGERGRERAGETGNKRVEWRDKEQKGERVGGRKKRERETGEEFD